MKKLLTGDEKKKLPEVIERFNNYYVPLIVPITLMNYYVRQYNKSYLQKQYYLPPHPTELKLRNHA